jgi:hypothetical protein
VNKNGVWSPRRAPPASTEEVGKRIFAEQVAWLRQRESRVQEAKRYQVEKELVGCTFKPVIPTRRSSISGPSTGLGASSAAAGAGGRRNSLPGRMVEAKGVDNFLERQKVARELAAEKANPHFADGSKWTGRVTRAIAPRFQSRGSVGDTGSTSSRAAGGVKGRVMAAIHTRTRGVAASAGSSAAAITSNVTAMISSAIAKVAAAAGKTVAVPSSAPSGAGAKGSSGAAAAPVAAVPAPRVGGEMATAEDIRARLRQLEAMNAATSGPSTRPASTGGLSATVVAGTAPRGLARDGAARDGILPPDIRFGVPSAPASTLSSSSLPLGVGGGFGSSGPGSPDPLLSRLEIMAAAAARR